MSRTVGTRWTACWLLLCVAACVAGSLPGRAAAADDKDLIAQIPSAANAAARVDVKALLSSPLGQKEGWQGKLMSGYSTRPLAVPAYATHFAPAAFLQIPDLSPMWQVSVIQTEVPVNLDRVAREQGGVIDKIGGRTAVTTQFDVLHVALSDTKIGTLWPADRQLAARLLDKKEGPARGPSDYLSAALKPDPQHPIVIALDLTEAYSPASVRRALSMGGLPSLDRAPDPIKLSDGLAKVRGVTVKVKVADAIQLNMAADFDGPVPIPADDVKAFCLDILNAAGLDASRFENLSYKASSNQITASGDATVETVGQLLGLLVPDAAHATLEKGVGASAGGATPAAPAKPDAGGGTAAAANSAAAASQEYYRTIAGMLDRLAARSGMSASATQLRNHARQIQQLPTLNVDPELLAWGAGIVDQLNRCAMILASGQMKAKNAAAAIESPVGDASWSDSGYSSTDTAESRAAFRNAQQQRREAAQSERLRASEEVFNVISASSRERSAIRQKMTEKYGVQF